MVRKCKFMICLPKWNFPCLESQFSSKIKKFAWLWMFTVNASHEFCKNNALLVIYRDCYDIKLFLSHKYWLFFFLTVLEVFKTVYKSKFQDLKQFHKWFIISRITIWNKQLNIITNTAKRSCKKCKLKWRFFFL